MREIQVQTLGWEDLLEKEKATHSSILAGRILWTEKLCGLHGVAKSWTWLHNIPIRYSHFTDEKTESHVGYIMLKVLPLVIGRGKI